MIEKTLKECQKELLRPTIDREDCMNFICKKRNLTIRLYNDDAGWDLDYVCEKVLDAISPHCLECK